MPDAHLPTTARSVTKGDSLVQPIAANYDLSDPISCALLVVGDNDTYTVRAGDSRYILRVYYPNKF